MLLIVFVIVVYQVMSAPTGIDENAGRGYDRSDCRAGRQNIELSMPLQKQCQEYNAGHGYDHADHSIFKGVQPVDPQPGRKMPVRVRTDEELEQPGRNDVERGGNQKQVGRLNQGNPHFINSPRAYPYYSLVDDDEYAKNALEHKSR